MAAQNFGGVLVPVLTPARRACPACLASQQIVTQGPCLWPALEAFECLNGVNVKQGPAIKAAF